MNVGWFLALFLVLTATRVEAARNWAAIAPSTAPSARSEMGLTYDPVRQHTLLFGGSVGPSETWTWNGTAWTKLFPATSPSPRSRHATTFDQARGQVLLFGGFTGGVGRQSDTWTWDGANWQRAVPRSSPVARDQMALAFDTARSETLMFGGSTTTGVVSDTWTWDGASWAMRTPATSPSARSSYGLAYDATRQRVVLFGGLDSGGGLLGDTWEWDGTNWSQKTPPLSPSSRSKMGMVYDNQKGRVTLTGGRDGELRFLQDSWEWDGTSWSPLTLGSAPPPREGHGMTYDGQRQRIVLFGGNSGGNLGTLFELPSAESNTPPVVSTGFSPTAIAGQTVRLSGTASDAENNPLTYTWRRSGGTGPAVALDDPSSPTPSFVPPAPGTYGFILTVSDNASGSTTSLVTVLAASTPLGLRSWNDRTLAASPSAREQSEMAFDDRRATTLLFGGSSGNSETWEWNGTAWTRRAPAQSPTGRQNHGLAFDTGRGRAVLFGGFTGGVGRRNDTWEWDGSVWTQLVPATSPSPRQDFAFAYDAARRELVLFGGTTQLGPQSETWTFDGAVWTLETPSSSPALRGSVSMAYDANRDRIVLFGGLDNSGNRLGDTWEWDGTTWTQLQPALSPSARSEHATAYDAARARVTIFGGKDQELRFLDDTWEWDGTRWSLVSPPVSPPGRERHAMVYDTARGNLVLFGGLSGGLRGDTFELSSLQTGNSTPTATAGRALVRFVGTVVTLSGEGSDPDNDQLAYAWTRVGGTGPSVSLNGATSAAASFTPPSPGTYVFELAVSDGRGGTAKSRVTVQAIATPEGTRIWENLSPSTNPTAREHHEMVFDSLRERVLLFGGSAGGAETWEWDGTIWTQRRPAQAPATRQQHGLAYDSRRGRAVLFGGFTGGIGRRNDTWEFDGVNWTQRVLATSPGPRNEHGMVFDSVSSRTLLFGGNLGVTSTAETWLYDGMSWSLQSPLASPPARHAFGLAFDEARGKAVLFGGTEPGGTRFGDTWEWDGTNWAQMAPPLSPSARLDCAMVYDTVRQRVLLFGGRDADLRLLQDAWEWDGTLWTQVNAGSAPVPRDRHGFAFDSARGRAVLFGGLAGSDRSDTLELASFQTANTPPVADADDSVIVTAGERVRLDADAFDADGDTLAYAWTRSGGSGSAVVLDRPTARDPAFTTGSAGTYTFTLTVTDGRGGTSQSRVTVLAVSSQAAARSWAQSAPSTPPAPRLEHATAFDDARGVTLLFGGDERGDTWHWDGANWTSLSPLAAPSGRSGHATAMDRQRGRVLLFGGRRGASVLDDTWQWDGFSWTEAASPTRPPAREDAALAFDSTRGRVVLFGGRDSVGGLLGDTWEWDGSSWSRFSPAASPAPRAAHAMAYDAARGVTLLFGGRPGAGPANDTWAWNGSTWTQVRPPSPPSARDQHAMAYVPSTRKILLFGGVDSVATLLADTWEWNGTTWSQIVTAGPSARKQHTLSTDTSRGRQVLFGGSGTGGRLGDTWEWTGNSWSQRTPAVMPSARSGHAMTYESQTGRSLLFGGSSGAETWEWDGTNWSLRSPAYVPPGRNDHALAYDSERSRAVLFGGSGNRSDTWEWDGTNWTQKVSKVSPAGRRGHAMVFDDNGARVLMFGGITTVPFRDTWVWDANGWAQLTPVTSPPARSFHAMAYDDARRRAVLFGGVDSTTLADTWEFDGTEWTQALPSSSPQSRQQHSMIFDTARKRVVLFGGVAQNGTKLGDTWEWDGSTWTQLGLTSSPGGRQQLAMTYDERRGRAVLFGGVNASFNLGDTWELASAGFGAAAPPVARTTLVGAADQPAQTLLLDGSASSGDSLVFSWSLTSGPAGASPLAGSGPIVSYFAAVAGTYVFTLTVTDSQERSDSATASIRIAASAPVARIAADASVILRDPLARLPGSITTDTIRLDGSLSEDPSTGIAPQYQWSLVAAPSGSSVNGSFESLALGASRLAVPLTTGTAGGRLRDAGRYVFGLTVTGAGGTGFATAAVEVVDPNNLAPRADAGIGQSISARVLQASPVRLAATIPDPTLPPPGNLRPHVRLDGRQSVDPRGRPIAYAWRAISSPAGTELPVLSDSASPIPTFVLAVSGAYVFGLTVDNGAFSSSESLTVVLASVEATNTPPNAEALARPAQPRAGSDLVLLDGTFSSDRESALLTYQWRQTGGRPVVLVGGATAARPRFVPPEADVYSFELVVFDGAGAASRPFPVSIDAIAPAEQLPVLSVVATASTTGEAGEDFDPGAALATPRSLRVTLPSTVTLSALVQADPLPAFDVEWKQLDGPTVLLVPTTAPAGAQSAVSFTPTTPRVHLFEATGRLIGAGGVPLRVFARRRVRVVVDSPARRVPRAVFSLFEGRKLKGIFSAAAQPETPIVQPGSTLTLDGSSSSDPSEDPVALSYRWLQVAGPVVVLSNPTNVVTTFVVPTLADANSHTYVFQLFVENEFRSEPAPAQFQAISGSAPVLGGGLTLIGVPVNPATTGSGYNADDLLRDTESTIAIRALPGGRFEVYGASTGTQPFAVEGNRGYFVARPGPAGPVPLAGSSWSEATRQVALTRGVNLLAYPPPVPAAATSETLCTSAAASLLMRFGGGSVTETYLPGLTAASPIEAGKGYLLIVPADVTLTLPAGP